MYSKASHFPCAAHTTNPEIKMLASNFLNVSLTIKPHISYATIIPLHSTVISFVCYRKYGNVHDFTGVF